MFILSSKKHPWLSFSDKYVQSVQIKKKWWCFYIPQSKYAADHTSCWYHIVIYSEK